jgi:hypothetical protein
MKDGWLSFKRAERLAKRGIIPELAAALEGLSERPPDDQIIRVHELLVHEDWGFDHVAEILSSLDSVGGALNFFALRRISPNSFTDDQILEAVRSASSFQKAREALFGNGQQPTRVRSTVPAPSRKRRSQRQNRPKAEGETAPEVLSAKEAPEPIAYREVSVSQLPHISGNAWFRRFIQCGWVEVSRKRSTGGSHRRLRKGSFEITFIQKGSGDHALRYTVWGQLKIGRVPEDEVRLLIEGGKRSKESSGIAAA